jgi:hypothetical protein
MAKLTNTQYSINRKTAIDSQLTNSWLSQNGINPEILNKLKSEILQATKIAKNILYNVREYSITQDEIKKLQSFLKHKSHTSKNCISILNLAKTIKRRKVRQAVT